jgi:hypothetical protein
LEHEELRAFLCVGNRNTEAISEFTVTAAAELPFANGTDEIVDGGSYRCIAVAVAVAITVARGASTIAIAVAVAIAIAVAIAVAVAIAIAVAVAVAVTVAITITVTPAIATTAATGDRGESQGCCK